jgi:2-polyprenyl-3-methyl-5-hydroxy-6-metoxy-1,4-benzoquinol methylase
MKSTKPGKLDLLPKDAYVTLPETDPLIYYYLPLLGGMYRRRVELALNECTGGNKILEVGYGSGVSFLNLTKKYEQIYGIDLHADPREVESMWNVYGVKPILKSGNLIDLPYEKEIFDTVLLISILEHIKPEEQYLAMKEIHRVLRPGGQMIYGVPVERPLMAFVFGLLGVNIREHHFSTEKDVQVAAAKQFEPKKIVNMKSNVPWLGTVYQVGHFIKKRD